MSEHTPTPWDIIAGDDYYIMAEGYPKEFIGHFKGDDNGGYLAVVGNRPADFGEANAAFIVKAVNNHERLVKALEDVRKIIVDGAMTGFNPLDGDWADRLFSSQAMTRAVLTDLIAPRHT
jgi:hypothetical protein